MKCPSCGYVYIKGQVKFCENCGASLIENDAGTDTAPDKTKSEKTPKPTEEKLKGKEYKCPSCASPLTYDIDSGDLLCEHCLNYYDIDEFVDSTHSGKKAKSKKKKNKDDDDEEGERVAFDWGDFKRHIRTDTIEGTSIYVCQSCGAVLELSHETAATTCPYCDNNIVLTNRLSGGICPNYVIPFAVTPDKLYDKVKAYYRNKKFLPKHFFDSLKIKDIQGVYVPFWMYDATLKGKVSFRGTTSRSYREGDYRCTEVTTYRITKDGSVSFKGIPVDGSKRMPDDLMDSIEPFDYSKAIPFNSAVLSGYIADRFDDDPDASLPRAETRMEASLISEFMKGEGYSDVGIHSRNMNISDADCSYYLLPVYIFTVEYFGKDYRFAVNGQTGKATGDVPVDNKRKKAWRIGVFSSAFAIFYALILFFFT